jgi:hypothetical protein
MDLDQHYAAGFALRASNTSNKKRGAGRRGRDDDSCFGGADSCGGDRDSGGRAKRARHRPKNQENSIREAQGKLQAELHRVRQEVRLRRESF